ncbi:MAG: 5'/3'-nucleotidase SurE [Candidatus Methylopumilus sp.]
MNILLSNDDGYDAPGIKILASYLKKIAHVTIVAPDCNRSGASNSLSLDRPLRVTEVEKDYYHINGTPTDCVHLALTGLLDKMPDMVISGINNGANMGDDTIYSGTVAAAMEGYLLDIPSFAISMSQHEATYFETAASITVDLIMHYQKNKLQDPILLNINVPDIPLEKIQGIHITRLGKRHKAEPVNKTEDTDGNILYWVGAAGLPNDGGEGTDFYSVGHDFVSVSPIHADLTRHNQINDLKTWMNNFK